MFLSLQNHPKLMAWGKLFFGFFLIWVFGWIVGPYFEHKVPVYDQITQVVEEREIDSAAYMYKDSVGSYDGEYYLADSFNHSGRDDYGATKVFFSGILACFLILGMGWKYVLK